jgi:hypothetical protein
MMNGEPRVKKNYHDHRKTRNLRLKLGLAAIIVHALIVSVVTYYFVRPNGEADDGEFAVMDTKLDGSSLDGSAIEETTDPQYPPRKLRYAWYETSGRDSKLIPRPQNLPVNSSYVKLTGEYDQWLLGTPVEISIPQTGKRYRSIVDRIAPDELGNVSIHAKPDVDEEEFLHLIVTFSSKKTLAYVSTTVGSYELSGSERGAWITSTESKQKQRDFTLKDVMETKRDRHATTKYVPPRED